MHEASAVMPTLRVCGFLCHVTQTIVDIRHVAPVDPWSLRLGCFFCLEPAHPRVSTACFLGCHFAGMAQSHEQSDQMASSSVGLMMTPVPMTRAQVNEQWGLYDGFDPKLEPVLRTMRRPGRHMPIMNVVPPGLDFTNLKVIWQCRRSSQIATLCRTMT